MGRAVLALLALAAAPVGAQVAPNRAAAYVFGTAVADARALWINPAGIAATRAASVFADLVIRDPGTRGARLGQMSVGFGSRGLAFGYQYDDFGGVRGHSYRLGLSGSTDRIALGFAAAWYRGGTSAWGYDLGATLRAAPRLVLGVTAANIAEPVVRGVQQDRVVVPGATLTLLGSRLELSALARLGGSAEGYAAGLRWHVPLAVGAAVSARIDTDRDLQQRGLAFGLAIGHRDQLGVVGTTTAGAAGVDGASVYGVAARRFR